MQKFKQPLTQSVAIAALTVFGFSISSSAFISSAHAQNDSAASAKSKKKKKAVTTAAPAEETIAPKKHHAVDPSTFESANDWTKHFGVGLALGYPISVVGKYWFDSTKAVDAGLDLGYFASFGFHGDFLYHFRDKLGNSSQFIKQVVPYVGGGLGLVPTPFVTVFSIRGVVGAEWLPQDPHIGVYLELVPAFSFATVYYSGIFFGGDVGIRYYF